LSAVPSYRVQVLTGETPFHDLQEVQVIESVLDGLRPEKPQDASAIGISDSLWDFVRLCWDAERTRRPAAMEVVDFLGEAAANWQTLVTGTFSLAGLSLGL
jgi:hypothetical protein